MPVNIVHQLVWILSSEAMHTISRATGRNASSLVMMKTRIAPSTSVPSHNVIRAINSEIDAQDLSDSFRN